MTAMRVPKQDWRAILDWVSRILEGRRAEIEVDALAIGAQLQGKNLVMFGLVYDDKDDLIAAPFAFEDGAIVVPDGPGWGIEVDPAKIERYRVRA